jgi:hypothetical protein
VVNVEFVYLPIFVESEIEFLDSDWAVFPHFRDRVARQSPSPINAFVQSIKLKEDEPARNFKNGEFGVRLTKGLPNLDLGLSYFYGWEDIPLPDARTVQGESIKEILLRPEQTGSIFSSLPGPVMTDDLTFDLSYHRFHLLGLDAATTWNDIGIRGELAYFKNRRFIREDDGAITKEDVLHAVVGADYSVSDNLYVNFLYSFEHVLDSKSLALRNRTEQDVVGNIDWDIKKDLLSLCFYAFYSLSDSSTYVNPALKWDAFENFRLETGFNLLWAGSGDILAPYRHNDNVYVLTTYHF